MGTCSDGFGASIGIRTDGTLWAWGHNGSGKLGLSPAPNVKSSPTQVGALTDWKQVDGASNTVHAVKTDGTLWSWGIGSSGRLGNGADLTNKSSPVQVGSLTDWASVGAGFKHTLAVKTDGTLWAWGDNSSSGDLGDVTVVDRISPVPIGALSDWASVAAGRNLSLARKTDGSIWAWGFNGQGQLGDGTIISRSSPVQIGLLTDWASASLSSYHSLALKT